MNSGKRFEKQIAKSIDSNFVKVYRLNDPAQSFGKNDALIRFSVKNPFDYFFFDSRTRTLYTIECKTVDANSISFERNKEDSPRLIHWHQIVALKEWGNYPGVISGLIIDFRKSDLTYFVPIQIFCSFIEQTNKVSLSIKDIESLSGCILINSKKLKVNKLYDMESFFAKANEERLDN